MPIVTLNFFDSVINFLAGIYSWFLGLIDSIVILFNSLRLIISFPTTIAGIVPGIIFTSVLVCIAVYVIRFLLLK